MKVYLAFFAILMIHFQALGGILTPAAQWVSELSTGPCDTVSESAFRQINQIAAENYCSLRVKDSQNYSQSLAFSENIFFEIARKEQISYLECEKSKLENFYQNQTPQLIADLKEKVPLLNELKNLINSKTGQWQLMRAKVPKKPYYSDDVKKSPQELELDELNEQIKNLMLQREMILEAIPLSKHSEFRDMIEDLDEEDVSDPKELAKQIQEASNEALFRLKNDLSDLAYYQNDIPTKFKEKVMQDPVFANHLSRTYGFDDKKFKPLHCYLDARYGSGARTVDTALIVGTTVVTGGVAGVLVKTVANSAKIVKLSKIKKTASALNANSNSLKALSYSGMGINGVQLIRDIESECFDLGNGLYHPQKTQNSCQSGDLIAEMNEKNCGLSIALPVLGGAASKLINPKAKLKLAQFVEKTKLEMSGRKWANERSQQTHYQEILKYRLQGQLLEAKAYEENLTKYMRHNPIQIKRMTDAGVSGARFVEYPDGTVGVWKPQRMLNENFNVLSAPAEIAAYKVDRYLGYNRVPVTIEKKLDGEKGTVQLVVDDLRKSKNEGNPNELSLFDSLIDNYDRHGGNYLLTKDGHIVPIDHGLSFKGGQPPQNFHARVARTSFDYKAATRRTKDESVKAHEKAKLIQNLSSLIGEKGPYLKLKETSERDWRILLKGEMNNTQIEKFLSNRKNIIETVEDMRKKYGDDIFRAGPASPVNKK